MGNMTEDLKKYAIGAGVGLVIYHYGLRAKYPTTFPALGPETAQKLIRENSILRTEMNKAMQKMATGAYNVPQQSVHRQLSYSEQAPDVNRNNRSLAFGFMANRPVPQSFGFLDGVKHSPEAKFNPDRHIKEDRQRRFGAMRPYNAAGFDQSTVRTDRETRFGFAGPRSSSLNPWGMW